MDLIKEHTIVCLQELCNGSLEKSPARACVALGQYGSLEDFLQKRPEGDRVAKGALTL